MFANPTDLHSARILLSVGMLMNVLESMEDLGIEPRGAADKQATGIVRMMGPAAVFCAVLQASTRLRQAERTGRLVDLLVEGTIRRRDALLDALPTPQRKAVERREGERSVPPDRVVQLFMEALAGSDAPAMMRKLGSDGGISRLQEHLDEFKRRVNAPVDPSTEGATGGGDGAQEPGAGQRPVDADTDDASAPTADALAGAAAAAAAAGQIPTDLLGQLGAVLARANLDEDALGRILEGTLPTEAPEGFTDDGSGTLRRDLPKVSRNEPCPCGSGRKYKKCHGVR